MLRVLGFLFFVCPLFVACTDPAAREAASQVRQGVEAIQAESERAASRPKDPAMEERCSQVTQEEMDEVEEKLENMNRETPVLGQKEMLALSCSRYQMYLRGELSSY